MIFSSIKFDLYLFWMLEKTWFGSSLHLWLTYLSITSSDDLFFLGRRRYPSNIFIFLPIYFPRDDTFSFVIYNSSYFRFFQSTRWHLVFRRFTCRPLGVHVHIMYHLGCPPLWWNPISNVCHMDWYRGKHALCFACLICMSFSHKPFFSLVTMCGMQIPLQFVLSLASTCLNLVP